MSTANGDIDFTGLQLIVELLGITDVEDLLLRLQVIKTHKPPKD